MKILVTGSAGFIGAALTVRLLARGDTVIGIDNHNQYYDQALKEDRVSQFIDHLNYSHIRMDISDRARLEDIFAKYQPQCVVNLAAQAGVRYSLENPSEYIDSNIVGFANILEACRHQHVQHLVYASSSSVYGANTVYPYAESQNVDHPLSLYAATKKSNELMAHAYSHLYKLPTTGLRFFTVYGPWGRPDMALYKFTKAILSNQPIQIFNYGKHRRDFTYIDDIVNGILLVLDRAPIGVLAGPDLTPNLTGAPYKIYNIGSGTSVELIEYIEALEKALGRTAKKEWLPAQPGDVPNTQSDIAELAAHFEYKPTIDIQQGVKKFVDWYLHYTKARDT
jgi:UDP-glucuronate 4-epimerase